MSHSFDPYRKWLGIRPEDQPPNHYRLLGIEPFEDDREVVESAANQRMSYLQELAVGPQVKASQKLLNEVSAARRCLLNPEQKAAYDRQLRAELDARQPKPRGPESAGHGGAVAGRPAVWTISGAAAGVAALLLFAWLIFAPGGGGDSDKRALLVLNWPLNERQGAVILIDGQEHPLPDKERVEIPVAEGSRELVLRRAGYQEIRRTRQFPANDPVLLQPNWQPE